MDDQPVMKNQPLSCPRRKRSQVHAPNHQAGTENSDAPFPVVDRNQPQVPLQHPQEISPSSDEVIIDPLNTMKLRVDSSKNVHKKRGSNATGEDPPTFCTQPTRNEYEEEEDDEDNEEEDDDWKSKPDHITTISPLHPPSTTTASENYNHTDCHNHNNNTAGDHHSQNTSSSAFPLALTLMESNIRAHIVDYYDDYDSIAQQGKDNKECWEAFYRQYFMEGFNFIRPSGNPIGMAGLVKLWTLGDLVSKKLTLVSVDNINIIAGGQAAVVVFTADQIYTYKGVRNSDRAVISMVMHVVNGRDIKFVHEHRTVGRTIPKETRWSTTES
jgi:hypothetical protein